MTSVAEALSLIEKHASRSSPEELPLFEALGCVLAVDVVSPIAMPSFDNSAMDGYVFRSSDVRTATPDSPVRLKVKGLIRAGDIQDVRLAAGHASRIMTGARVPANGDIVLPMECATVEKSFLILRKTWPAGHNIRRRGEELKERERVLEKGSPINPALVGILASLGKKTVKAYPKPRVSVIVTGSELVEAGEKIKPGEIYDSNLPMLQAALLQAGIRPVFTSRLGDRRRRIEQVLIHALKNSDIVVMAGGVSAGQTDLVRPALKALGTRTVFWKVSQKPGKPLYFGKKGKTMVFGLPGNPAAVFVCFYEYVYPAIRRFMGFSEPGMRAYALPLSETVKTDPDKSLFLKATVDHSSDAPQVSPLPRQASHMISSLAHARGILAVPRSASPMPSGEKAVFHVLPYPV